MFSRSCNLRSETARRPPKPPHPQSVPSSRWAGLLQRVDQPAARIESRCAMRRGHRDQHAGLADFQLPQPMHQAYVSNLKVLHGLRRERVHLLQRHLLVGFVHQIQRSPPRELSRTMPSKTTTAPSEPRFSPATSAGASMRSRVSAIFARPRRRSPEAAAQPRLLRAAHGPAAHIPGSPQPPPTGTPDARSAPSKSLTRAPSGNSTVGRFEE